MAVHFQSARLKHNADMVWVAVFAVLEAIISELSTKSTSRFFADILSYTVQRTNKYGHPEKALKALIKGDAYTTEVTEALAVLDASVGELVAEANICDSERLTQVDRVTRDTWLTTKRTESDVQGEQTDIKNGL